VTSTKRKVVQGFKENLIIVAGEKRGALKVATLMEQAAYRTVLAKLV